MLLLVGTVDRNTLIGCNTDLKIDIKLYDII